MKTTVSLETPFSYSRNKVLYNLSPEESLEVREQSYRIADLLCEKKIRINCISLYNNYAKLLNLRNLGGLKVSDWLVKKLSLKQFFF